MVDQLVYVSDSGHNNKVKPIVFHAFQKKSQKTPLKEINLARKRLKEALREENV
jgi:phage-related protein